MHELFQLLGQLIVGDTFEFDDDTITITKLKYNFDLRKLRGASLSDPECYILQTELAKWIIGLDDSEQREAMAWLSFWYGGVGIIINDLELMRRKYVDTTKLVTTMA